MNKLMIIGNLTADPQLRTVDTANGQVSVCDFSVAVNRRKQSNQQKGQPEADFFRCTVWRGLADNCAKYLAKGRKVGVVGSVSVRTYTGNDGIVRASLEVNADDVEFLTPNPNGQNGGGYQNGGYQNPPQYQNAPAPQYQNAPAPQYQPGYQAPPQQYQQQPVYQQQQMPIAGAPAAAVPQGFTAVETDDLPF